MSGTSQAQTWHYALAGIFLSNLCHLLSSLVLYKLLTKTDTRPHQHRVAFVAAILHILTPASLFMSAPYTESIFSLLNFAGMLQYVQATITVRASGSKIYEDLCKLSSGLLFGLATLMRSNGLLSGLLFVYDVGRYVPRAVSMQLTTHDMRRVLVTTMAGTMIAVGYILPQYLAYREYCVHSPSLEGPPWCSRTIPGIYTWVQSHYW
jgi:GPI mannosyltransferase 2